MLPGLHAIDFAVSHVTVLALQTGDNRDSVLTFIRRAV